MKKIVFLDIDGTILNSNREIPDSTKKSIELLRNQGIYVAIATGRSPFMFSDIRKELDIDTFVSFNGQFVKADKKLVYEYSFPINLIEELKSMSEKHGHSLVYMSDKTMKANVVYDSKLAESLNDVIGHQHPEYDPDYYKHNSVHQMLLTCQEGEELMYAKVFPMFKFVRWHEYCVDVLPIHGSKAEGIEKLIQVLGYKMEDTYGFGDGLNDIEMLQTVGTGVAMGNAHPELKKHADVVTKHVDEDGIYHGLKELGLI